MENPFIKLVREGEGSSMEGKKVVGIGRDTEKGILEWWEKYSDGSESRHQQDRSVNLSSRDDVERRIKELEKEHISE